MFHEVYLPSFSSSHKNRGNWGELTFAEAPGIVTRDTPVSLLLIGRLSNNDGRRLRKRHLKSANCAVSNFISIIRQISINSSNVGNFFWS